ncbi:MAG: hypothetical protein AAF386_09480 [Pseudomonadota bacterium]
MTQDTPKKAPKPKAAADDRAARLKAALKANMGRRKAQARARAAKADGDHGKGS